MVGQHETEWWVNMKQNLQVTIKDSWIVRLLLLTPLLLFVVVLLIGGGHGWYEPAMIIFPLGTFNTIWQGHLSIPFVALAIIRFPVYGFIIGKSRQHRKVRWTTLLILLFYISLTTLVGHNS